MLHGHGEKLSRFQERAIAALLSTRTIQEAAHKAGIGERSLRRWLKLESFRVAYYQARQETFSQIVALAQQIGPSAVLLLGKIIRDEGVAPGTRVRAAAELLDFARTGARDEELELRLRLLENASRDEEESSGAGE